MCCAGDPHKDVLASQAARLTALLLSVAAGRRPVDLAAMTRQTPLPNGGWPTYMLIA
jgi:hypothetical protein